MKKFSLVMLAVLLSLAFVSCDTGSPGGSLQGTWWCASPANMDEDYEFSRCLEYTFTGSDYTHTEDYPGDYRSDSGTFSFDDTTITFTAAPTEEFPFTRTYTREYTLSGDSLILTFDTGGGMLSQTYYRKTTYKSGSGDFSIWNTSDAPVTAVYLIDRSGAIEKFFDDPIAPGETKKYPFEIAPVDPSVPYPRQPSIWLKVGGELLRQELSGRVGEWNAYGKALTVWGYGGGNAYSYWIGLISFTTAADEAPPQEVPTGFTARKGSIMGLSYFATRTDEDSSRGTVNSYLLDISFKEANEILIRANNGPPKETCLPRIENFRQGFWDHYRVLLQVDSYNTKYLARTEPGLRPEGYCW